MYQEQQTIIPNICIKFLKYNLVPNFLQFFFIFQNSYSQRALLYMKIRIFAYPRFCRDCLNFLQGEEEKHNTGKEVGILEGFGQVF